MNKFFFNAIRFVVTLVLSKLAARAEFVDSEYTSGTTVSVLGITIGHEECYVMTNDSWFVATAHFSLSARAYEDENTIKFFRY